MDCFSFKYRHRDDEYDDPRRAFLVRALTLGLLGAGGGLAWPARLAAMSDRPVQLPPGRSIHRLRGEVRINGVAAQADTRIRPDDDIETGSNSEIVFAVGSDAFILRENGHLQLAATPLAGAPPAAYCASGESALLSGLRLVSGKLLSVFGVREAGERLDMRTPTATIGIRGTGIYLEAEDERTYVCTCYGTTRLATADASPATERITASHHDAPRYILGAGPVERRIRPAPVINHTDMELVMIEALVGRRPPFHEPGAEPGY